MLLHFKSVLLRPGNPVLALPLPLGLLPLLVLSPQLVPPARPLPLRRHRFHSLQRKFKDVHNINPTWVIILPCP